MKSCGLIVEYNPFHNGHKLHAEKARALTQAEVVIAVMSGNFLQRGEPAIIDKWRRCREALANGADLVIELPFCYAVQSADYFAKGTVGILQQIGCEALCFGTDGQETFDYQAFGKFSKDSQKRIDEAFQSLKSSGMSYPQKMREVFQKLYPAIGLQSGAPNHILGLSYAKENAGYLAPMRLFPIQREKAAYLDADVHDSEIASATAVRRLALDGKSPRSLVPKETLEDLKESYLMDWEKFWPFLRYKIFSSSPEELRMIYQMREGLEHRIIQLAGTGRNFRDFAEKLKSKRYTWVRLQRLLTYVLGNVSEAEISSGQADDGLRILGFTEAGQTFIREHRDLPWISRFGKKEGEKLSLDLKMDKLYQMADPSIPEQNFGRHPIRYEEKS